MKRKGLGIGIICAAFAIIAGTTLIYSNSKANNEKVDEISNLDAIEGEVGKDTNDDTTVELSNEETDSKSQTLNEEIGGTSSIDDVTIDINDGTTIQLEN